MMRARLAVVVATAAFVFASMSSSARAEQCGTQAGGALCPNCLCCSQFGWCGTTSDYCGSGCQSQCGCEDGFVCDVSTTPAANPPTPSTPTPTLSSGGGSVASIISESLFNKMLPANGFYTYAAFIAAANKFPGFGTTGGANAQKRELAAFLAQTSHETTGGWPAAPDGPYTWGYCVPSERWPCAAGKKYYGRGPIQIISGPAGQAIGAGILSNPDLVASFETAVWFWMTPQPPKPSCHTVMTGQWTASDADIAAGRLLPGYGLVTNIINGGLECGHGADSRVADRIGFYKRYCDLLGVSYGINLDCGSQRPYSG